MTTRKRFKCRFCGAMLPGCLPVAQRPDGAMLLSDLWQSHPGQVGPYLELMRTECIATVAAEAYAVVE
jgi:hypothetical protein